MWHVRRGIQDFWWGNLKQRDHLEDLGIDGMITLIQICKKDKVGLDYIDLAQGRERWRIILAVTNRVVS
jgi:hypothetical protein